MFSASGCRKNEFGSLDHSLWIERYAHSLRRPTVPGRFQVLHLDEDALTDSQRKLSASLMRVNHTGEVCAQALYEGQMLAARDEPVRKLLGDAAREETEHLAWTERRLSELGWAQESARTPLLYWLFCARRCRRIARRPLESRLPRRDGTAGGTASRRAPGALARGRS